MKVTARDELSGRIALAAAARIPGRRGFAGIGRRPFVIFVNFSPSAIRGGILETGFRGRIQPERAVHPAKGEP
jgi:hypothetical protein